MSISGVASEKVWQIACQRYDSIDSVYKNKVIVLRQPQNGNTEEYEDLFNFEPGNLEKYKGKKEMHLEVLYFKKGKINWSDPKKSISDILNNMTIETVVPIFGTGDRMGGYLF